MSKTWILIKIGQKTLSPILLFDGTQKSSSSSMPTLSCSVYISQRVSEIPIDFIYLEGESTEQKEICRDRIKLIKETGLINYLSTLLGGNKTYPVKIDIFFNENENGLCIGFLTARFLPAKYIIKSQFRGVGSCGTDNFKESINKFPYESNMAPNISAKELFTSNYAKFEALIPLTAAQTDNDIAIKWEEVINSLENSQALLIEFKKYREHLNSWLKLLCSWGLKQDGCVQYPGILLASDPLVTKPFISQKYRLVDSELINPDKTYKVIVPCWTIWLDLDGKPIEKIVSRGFIEEIKHG